MELFADFQTLIRYLCRASSDTVLDLRDHVLDFWDWVLGREVEIIEGPKPFMPVKSPKSVPASSPSSPNAPLPPDTPSDSR
ncbi:MAG TPA: hypothetical protein PLA90_03680 [Candidatus Sumerlaeota bacterium]|nr:hypothetical protein [Candidatus Sumerlaeota bacterium]HPS00619.1 hypothetical protein [Candidatus Sumerlaeota bacterium]